MLPHVKQFWLDKEYGSDDKPDEMKFYLLYSFLWTLKLSELSDKKNICFIICCCCPIWIIPALIYVFISCLLYLCELILDHLICKM